MTDDDTDGTAGDAITGGGSAGDGTDEGAAREAAQPRSRFAVDAEAFFAESHVDPEDLVLSEPEDPNPGLEQQGPPAGSKHGGWWPPITGGLGPG